MVDFPGPIGGITFIHDPFGHPVPNAVVGLIVGQSNDPATPGVQGHNDKETRGFIAGQNPFSTQHVGIYGESAEYGVLGIAKTAAGIGVFGTSVNGAGTAVQGDAGPGGMAGKFNGDVEVTGNIRVQGDVQLLLPNQDCAEDFEILGAEEIGPGSVVVIDAVGALKQSDKAYDKRVVGVISGAGDCRPGIILGREQVQGNRMPVALLGKVYCKVDASREPIEVGDLLTTSPTPGHAMKAEDPFKAFGAVIGKALRPLEAGQGLIPILIALQ